MEDIFYIITMKTKNNKTLYLQASDKELKNDKMLFEWTFNKDNAIWFENYTETINFANEYFKNFKNWNIKEIKYYI